MVKKWITATLGKGSAVGLRWPRQALAQQPELVQFDARAVGTEIKGRYPFLSNPAGSVTIRARLRELDSVGTPQRLLTHRLMAIEADALTMSIDYLRRVRGVLAMPVHDSLIVPARCARIAQETIELAFSGRAGVIVRTKVQTLAKA